MRPHVLLSTAAVATALLLSGCSMTFKYAPRGEYGANKSSFPNVGDKYDHGQRKPGAFAANPADTPATALLPSGPHKVMVWGPQWLAHTACTLNEVLKKRNGLDDRFDQASMCAHGPNAEVPTNLWYTATTIPESKGRVIKLKLVKLTGEGVAGGVKLELEVKASVGGFLTKTYKITKTANEADKEIFADLGRMLLADEGLWGALSALP